MMIERDLEQVAEILLAAKYVVILTGAGISKESGIPTFRGKDGLWRNYRAEDLATPYAFSQDPIKVWEWYDWRRKLISEAKPNVAHNAIAEMENFFGKLIVITQNIDGLHKRAGTKNIIELHGNIFRARCPKEQRTFEFKDVPLSEIPPKCRCGSVIRPDVVWFGEPMPFDEVKAAFSHAEECDTMLVIGTSALVQPAANLPFTAKKNNATVLEVNINPTPVTQIADVSLFGKAGEILPRLWDMIK